MVFGPQAPHPPAAGAKTLGAAQASVTPPGPVALAAAAAGGQRRPREARPGDAAAGGAAEIAAAPQPPRRFAELQGFAVPQKRMERREVREQGRSGGSTVMTSFVKGVLKPNGYRIKRGRTRWRWLLAVVSKQ